MFRPRSTMLTLYGDYVRQRRGEIGIGSLIKLLGNFGLTEQSVRSAVSRMCREGLLKVRRDGLKSYYALTKDGFSLLDKGAHRIFELNTCLIKSLPVFSAACSGRSVRISPNPSPWAI